ncbi:MAG: hypothetical protein WEE03_05180 [Chloroflexota bacterium]
MFRNISRRSVLISALSALLVAACAPAANAPGPGPSGTASGGASATPVATPLPIAVSEAKYGLLSVRTVPGARCEATLRVPAGVYGDPPPDALPGQSAGADGFVTWTYSAPRVPSGTAGYSVHCQGDAASEVRTGNFTIPTHPIVASSLRVRVTTATPQHEQVDQDPSLVALRDATLARLNATLAAEWKSATRGMGSLEIADSSTDITIFVIAARGTSVHRTSLGDDSQDILIYVSDERGCLAAPPFSCPRNVENNVAVALHELGHIWCCHGPEATDGGHWTEKQQSPGLYGVDKYGLMNEPVLCTQFGAILSCPNRFSDREMVALGFTNFPPPAPDPCITQSLSLRSQINTIEAQLVSLRAQVKAIETQYPGGVPSAIYSDYLSLVSQYNTLVARQNALVAQLNALPCDSS